MKYRLPVSLESASASSRQLSSGHGLSSVSIESLVMGLVEAKKEAERAVCARAAARRPARRANAFSFEIADETPHHNPLQVKSKKKSGSSLTFIDWTGYQSMGAFFIFYAPSINVSSLVTRTSMSCTFVPVSFTSIFISLIFLSISLIF